MFAKHPLTITADNFIPAIQREIAQIYPQKAAYVGSAGLEMLIRKGMGGAQRQQFMTVRGMTLVVVLMLAFGHGCGADPLYPWIGKTLQDDMIIGSDARAERLEKKALTWLEHVLAYLGKGIQR